MDLLFLGTSSGIPTKQRNVTGLALLADHGRRWYLVDCGEATQHQLLHTPLSVIGLQAIFITHVHGDHSYGLPGLLASAAMAGRTAPLPIIAPQAILDWLEATQRLTALFLPYPITWIAVESLTDWQDHEVVVTHTPLSHRVPCYAYSFRQSAREPRLDVAKLRQAQLPAGPLWGQLQQGRDVVYGEKTWKSAEFLLPPLVRTIVVGGDNDQPDLLAAACRDAQVLVHEATYTEEVTAKVGDRVQHSSAARVAAFAERVGLPNLILTHFSARYQHDVTQSPSIADIRREAAAHYHGRLWLAEDHARYRLDSTGALAQVMPE